MNELITAAKGVIESWDHGRPIQIRLKNLRAAVERAEKQNVTDFEEWWLDQELSDCNRGAAKIVWTAAQQDERKRIKDIIATLGVSGIHDMWFDCCDRLMEKIDATTE